MYKKSSYLAISKDLPRINFVFAICDEPLEVDSYNSNLFYRNKTNYLLYFKTEHFMTAISYISCIHRLRVFSYSDFK